jgi:hypothetical protein
MSSRFYCATTKWERSSLDMPFVYACWAACGDDGRSRFKSYERAAASEMSHATTIGMTSCAGTSQAIHPGEWSWSSQSLASMP